MNVVEIEIKDKKEGDNKKARGRRSKDVDMEVCAHFQSSTLFINHRKMRSINACHLIRDHSITSGVLHNLMMRGLRVIE